MAIPFLVGGVVLTLGGAAVEGAAVDWSREFVVAFVYASLVGTALSWSLWFGLVGSGEAGRAASYIFFVPLISLVIGAVFLHETSGRRCWPGPRWSSSASTWSTGRPGVAPADRPGSRRGRSP